MMRDVFLKWNEKNKNKLAETGVNLDCILIPEEITNNNCVSVDYLTEKCFGRVSVWETGNIDVEILDIESEVSLFYECYECDNQTDFERLLIKFFNVLRTGKSN